jgi:hypothetical protein
MTRVPSTDTRLHFERLEWNSIYQKFYVLGDDGGSDLPRVSQGLVEDVSAWQTYLRENFKPQDSVFAGEWRADSRWWFVDEARRLDNEFRRQLAGQQGEVRVSPYPGLIPIDIHADYGDWPLWTVEGGTGPEDFPMLSDLLREDLIEWAVTTEVGRPTSDVGKAFVRRLRAELGPEFDVTY